MRLPQRSHALHLSHLLQHHADGEALAQFPNGMGVIQRRYHAVCKAQLSLSLAQRNLTLTLQFRTLATVGLARRTRSGSHSCATPMYDNNTSAYLTELIPTCADIP